MREVFARILFWELITIKVGEREVILRVRVVANPNLA